MKLNIKKTDKSGSISVEGLDCLSAPVQVKGNFFLLPLLVFSRVKAKAPDSEPWGGDLDRQTRPLLSCSS